MATIRKKSGKALEPEVRNIDIWLKALEEQDGLTDWEKGFVGSVSDWFYMKGKDLTTKQYEALERIYRRFN